MSVAITVRETPKVTILEVTGRVALGATGPSVQDAVRDVLDKGRKHIVLDLGGVSYFDSSGLGQLVGSYATTVSRGGEIKLVNLNKKVYDLMQITKLYTVFSIYADEQSALDSFEVTPASASV